jgi:hypothetical protein
MAETHSHAVPPYGPAIQQAIAAGDLARALEVLKAEIARRGAADP